MCLKETLKKLSPMLSETRKSRIASVVASRTNSLAILLENIHNDANQNAVMRSMDALGCLHLHTLQTESSPSPGNQDNALPRRNLRYPPRTDAGARTWIDVHQWSDTKECITHLKSRHGFTLACAFPDAAATPITSVDFDQKLLVAFGNERDGISEELADLAEIKFSLPMCGFVESYNVSVSVSLVLFHAYLHRIKKAPLTGGDLSEQEQLEWTYRYYMKSIGTEKLKSRHPTLDHKQLQQVLMNTLS